MRDWPVTPPWNRSLMRSCYIRTYYGVYLKPSSHSRIQIPSVISQELCEMLDRSLKSSDMRVMQTDFGTISHDARTLTRIRNHRKPTSLQVLRRSVRLLQPCSCSCML